MARTLTFIVILLVAGCSPADLLKLGGGPNVAANGQAGKENRQAVISIEAAPKTAAPRQVVTTERVETIVHNNEAPAWIWILVIVGWILPSPSEIGRWASGLFRKR